MLRRPGDHYKNVFYMTIGILYAFRFRFVQEALCKHYVSVSGVLSRLDIEINEALLQDGYSEKKIL